MHKIEFFQLNSSWYTPHWKQLFLNCTQFVITTTEKRKKIQKTSHQKLHHGIGFGSRNTLNQYGASIVTVIPEHNTDSHRAQNTCYEHWLGRPLHLTWEAQPGTAHLVGCISVVSWGRSSLLLRNSSQNSHKEPPRLFYMHCPSSTHLHVKNLDIHHESVL